MPFGLGTLLGQLVERVHGPQAEHPAGGIDAGLALVGEVEVAVGGEVQVVEPLKPSL